jgi:hypothetical protein
MNDSVAHPIDDKVKNAQIDILNIHAIELSKLLDSFSINNSIDIRKMALAQSRLEECVMWAVKAIT